MAVKIRGGSSTSKTRPTAKRGAKATTRPTSRAPRKTASKAPARKSTNRSSKTDLPERQLQRILDNLAKAAALRTDMFEAHREAVEASNRLILDAEEQGVPVHMIVESAQIARQQFYKLLQDAAEGRLGNGQTGAARQRPGRKPNVAPKAARKSGTKTVARKPAAKTAPKRAIKSSGGVKIRRKG
jgi:outer membrane PBP1 activator LpoA protein